MNSPVVSHESHHGLMTHVWLTALAFAAISATSAALANVTLDVLQQQAATAQWNFAGRGSYVTYGDALNISSAGAINAMVA